MSHTPTPRERHARGGYLPDAVTIRRRCLQIQRRWTPEEERARRGLPRVRLPWTTPLVADPLDAVQVERSE